VFARTSILFGIDVHVSSGETGHISDFLISGHLQALRYLVVATRADHSETVAPVPISAAADPELARNRISLGLSCEELGHLSGIDLLGAPSREKEKVLHDKIHWRPYWREGSADTRTGLHSLRRLLGMRVCCSDGPAGTLNDFITDTANWSVPVLELRCGRQLEEDFRYVPAALIESPDWSEDTIEVAATRQQVVDTPFQEGQLPLSRPGINTLLSHFHVNTKLN
jgi:hypothetical protein